MRTSASARLATTIGTLPTGIASRSSLPRHEPSDDEAGSDRFRPRHVRGSTSTTADGVSLAWGGVRRPLTTLPRLALSLGALPGSPGSGSCNSVQSPDSFGCDVMSPRARWKRHGTPRPRRSGLFRDAVSVRSYRARQAASWWHQGGVSGTRPDATGGRGAARTPRWPFLGDRANVRLARIGVALVPKRNQLPRR
jgi:hypothetical protein